MTDEELADEVVARLNALLESGAGPALATLCGAWIPVDLDPEHPTIQVDVHPGGATRVGFLGMLNGLVGAIPSGPRAGWGHVAARFEDGRIVRFERTDSDPDPDGPTGVSP